MKNGGAHSADEVFVVLTLPPDLVPKSAVSTRGGRCHLQTPLVGCNLGRLAPGASKTITLVAFANRTGTVKTTAKVLTSDRDTGLANNSRSLTTKVTGTATTVSYSSGDIAVAIPDAGSVDVPLPITSEGTVLRVAASVRLDHTFDSDLVLSLVSPTGTVVVLSRRNGGAGDGYGSGANDCSGTPTTFDDLAATSIVAGTAPFPGSFVPQEPLRELSGEDQQGGWKLRIADQVSGDTGTVGCVRLKVRTT